MNPGIKILCTKFQRPSRRTYERAEVMSTFSPQDGKLSLKADEPQNGMKIWKGMGSTTTLLFFLKGLDILHQERRGKEKTIVLEHFNGILFHKSRHANKQHTNHHYQPPISVGNDKLIPCSGRRYSLPCPDTFLTYQPTKTRFFQ